MSVPWSILWSKTARKDLNALDPPTLKRIIEGIDAFALNGVGDVKKLQGSNEFRLRVGDWRVVFVLSHESDTILIKQVAHRREAYR